MKRNYYKNILAAERLKRCYEIAPPRVQQYLEAEIEYVLAKVKPGDSVLELGCGYGRVLERLAAKTKNLLGIDTSRNSLKLARKNPHIIERGQLCQMDAILLAFKDRVFDITLCIQNGISAFKVSPLELMREAVRVTKVGGIVLFSSYSDKFWQYRLEWFEMQAEAELLGEIDHEKTGNGIIVCKDGFQATTFLPSDLLRLTSEARLEADIIEIDESSLFCEIRVK